ncbi:MAG: enoyl-CoA hydratase/isomerase family protein [Flavobacterium sp.]|nr:enoyl-CoA hydratase/isomerase family protein [Flavobacterium sp.]
MNLDENNGSISSTINNKIATLTFGHPLGNSFPSSLLQKFTSEINRLSENNDVAIIVLKSEGNGPFCGGASFQELLNIETFEDGKQFFSGFANVINAMRKCTKLIIGNVQGKAVGGGVGLVAACDFAFATENASIKLSELSIGIGPFVIEPVVTKKIGKSALTELSLMAKDWKDATWAKEKGLYNFVFSDIVLLEENVQQFCEDLANYNLEALTEMKKVFWENTSHWDDLLIERAAISGKLVLSDFTKKALAGFRK